MNAKSCFIVLGSLPVLAGCGDGLPLDPGPEGAPRTRGSGNENLVVAAAALGMQPAVLEFTVPAPSAADIVSARLRWVGRSATSGGDGSIVINSHQRTATLLARYNVGGTLPWVFFYEYDAITLVRPGLNRFYVSGFNLGGASRADGIGACVVYEDPASPWTSVQLLDPREYVEGQSGAVWEFPIGGSPAPRNGRLVLFAGDCTVPGVDRVWWSAGPGPAPGDLVGGAPNVLESQLRALLGERMDLLSLDVSIPAGASHFAYQIESPPGLGDSIVHFLGALCADGQATDCTGSIAGRVFLDSDRDGAEDAGEPGMANVAVQLRGAADGLLVATLPTDASGAFALGPICAGDYVVEVDEATLPPGLEQTSCGVGDCSPRTVAVPADDAGVLGLAFGWAEPPAPTGGCFFGLDFWQREFAVTSGVRRIGHNVDVATLDAILPVVEAATAVEFARRDGVLRWIDVVTALDDRSSSACALARRHYLASLLNFAYNGGNRALVVDTDDDGVGDMTYGRFLGIVEALFARRDDASCETIRRMASSANGTPAQGGCQL
jgi:hypothetical protein